MEENKIVFYVCREYCLFYFNGHAGYLDITMFINNMWYYKNPLHLDVVDRYLRRMGDKTIPDEAPPSLESFYPTWVAGIDLPQSRCCGFFVSFTNKHK